MSANPYPGESKPSNRLEALNWVLAELKKSATIVTGSLLHALNEKPQAGQGYQAKNSPATTSNIKLALAEVHRAVGALQMLGLVACAGIYRDIALLLERCLRTPSVIDEESYRAVRLNCISVNTYLSGINSGRTWSSFVLLPAAQSAATLAKRGNFHPAQVAEDTAGYVSGPLQWSILRDINSSDLNTSFDGLLLKMLRNDRRAKQVFASKLRVYGESSKDRRGANLSFFGAACLNAWALGVIDTDINLKRTAVKLAQWLQGDRVTDSAIESLLRETQYFLNRSYREKAKEVFPGILAMDELDYLQPVIPATSTDFRVFDPELYEQAIRHLTLTKSDWALVTSGTESALQGIARQFKVLHRVMVKLWPELARVTEALETSVSQVLSEKGAIPEDLSLEVATAMLFLDETLEDVYTTDSGFEKKIQTLCERLSAARNGAPLGGLQEWMENLFHRSGARHSLGNVVGELSHIAGEIEREFELLFSGKSDHDILLVLQKLKTLLAQIKGVLGVIGLDQGVLTAVHLQKLIAGFEIKKRSDPDWSSIVSNVGSNMVTLGLMIDMLGYQPGLANRLFVFDAKTQLLNLVTKSGQTETSSVPSELQPSLESTISGLPSEQSRLAGDELQGVFVQEAKDVVDEGLDFVSVLASNSKDLETLISLRRGFHTLKGSARMVGFTELGESAWIMEQLLNEQLTNESEPVSDSLCSLAKDALGVVRRWADFLGQGQDPGWSAEPFNKSALLLRQDKRYHPIEMPPVRLREAPVQEPPIFDAGAVAMHEVDPLREVETSQDASKNFGETDGQDSNVSKSQEESVPNLLDHDNASESVEQQVGNENQVDGDTATEVASPDPLVAGVSDALPMEDAESVDESDQFKVIGTLKIKFNLYSVFLQEADELSRVLENTVDEWLMDPSQSLPREASHLTHTLAGVSATVGFDALAELCKYLEAVSAVLCDRHGYGIVMASSLKQGADSVRQLLHQFAAGFLKEPDPALIKSLQDFLVEHPNTGAMDSLLADDDDDALVEETLAKTDGEFGEGFSQPPLDQALPDSEESSETLQPSVNPSTTVDGLEPVTLSEADLSIAAIFSEEAAELIPQIAHTLHIWLSTTGAEADRQEVLRGLHTLKGSARLSGALEIGDRVHLLESLVETVDTSDREAVRVLFDHLDAIERDLGKPTLSRADNSSALEVAQTDALSAPEQTIPVTPASSTLSTSTTSRLLPVVAPDATVASRSAPVRVSARLLDMVMNRVGEVIGARTRVSGELNRARGALGELDANIERLRVQLRELEIQAESQMQSRMVMHKDTDSAFDPLELDRYTRVQELTRMMAESVSDVATVQLNLSRYLDSADDVLVEQGRQSKDLQRELLRTRIVAFETLSPRLVRTVRQASNDTDKLVQFNLQGGGLEIDRQQLERIGPSLEHLIRNAVAHGIELPSDRLAQGKPETGLVEVSVRQDRNDVSIEIRDDGRGLDLEGIRLRAMELGLLSSDDALDSRQAFELICLPGFSTVTQISELAGRGIGMDIVRSSVNSSGGRLEVENLPGQGLTVRMILPLTTATTQVLLVRHGEQLTAIPVNMVEQVLRFLPKDLEQAYNAQEVVYAGETVPFYWAGALLGTSTRSVRQDFRSQPVVVARSAGRRVAVHIDETVGQREVLVRGVGDQLAHLPGLTGVSILADGNVVLIYNPVALALVYGDEIRRFGADKAAPDQLGQGLSEKSTGKSDGTDLPPCILVVDDSITVRKVSQRLLERAGYRVSLASDGLAALALLRKDLAEQPPFLILADIEMPKMDGFEMIRTIRGDARIADIPVIVITSRLAEKHRDVAFGLGVDHYLGKPFVEDDLLAMVADYYARVTLKA